MTLVEYLKKHVKKCYILKYYIIIGFSKQTNTPSQNTLLHLVSTKMTRECPPQVF
jgi:hypothetical protein